MLGVELPVCCPIHIMLLVSCGGFNSKTLAGNAVVLRDWGMALGVNMCSLFNGPTSLIYLVW